MRSRSLLVLVFALTNTALVAAPNALRAHAGPAVPHVMVIVEENREASTVAGSSQAPYISMLANTYGLAVAAYAQSHPSLPNYLELVSGSTWGVTDDGTGYSFSGPTLIDQLAQSGMTWRAYMEDMPSPCFSGGASGGYAKKHDPFMYFASVTNSDAQCRNVVPYAQFRGDLTSSSPPDFMWVTPNLCDDGHDCSTTTADSWLAANLPPVLASGWFTSGGIVIVTWDEGGSNAGCCNGAWGGHIATIVIASGVSDHRTMSSDVDHAGTLRTIEDLYGLAPLRDASCACSGSLAPLLPAPAASGPSWLSVPHLR